VNGAIKCQQISGGDGYATMGDGTQTYMFSFGPLSGLSNIALGLPGTDFPSTFNNVYAGTLVPGDPATTEDAGGAFMWNGAVGLIGDPNSTVPTAGGVTAHGTAVVAGGIIEDVAITSGGSGYLGPAMVTFGPPTCTPGPACATAIGTVEISAGKIVGVDVGFAGEGYTTTPSVTFSTPLTGCTGVSSNDPTMAGCYSGHVDPRPMMGVGVMNGNIPAPLMAIDEDEEFFLTLSNVGMIMRPDLFEQHGSLPRLSECFRILRRRAGRIGRHQHRRQLHLLLPRARRRHLFLPLPYHPARALADGHGGANLCAAAAGSRPVGHQPL
jgi:hypothetical protein